MPAQTHLFPCLKDNFGVLLHDPETGATAAIDTAGGTSVERFRAAKSGCPAREFVYGRIAFVWRRKVV